MVYTLLRLKRMVSRHSLIALMVWYVITTTGTRYGGVRQYSMLVTQLDASPLQTDLIDSHVRGYIMSDCAFSLDYAPVMHISSVRAGASCCTTRCGMVDQAPIGRDKQASETQPPLHRLFESLHTLDSIMLHQNSSVWLHRGGLGYSIFL